MLCQSLVFFDCHKFRLDCQKYTIFVCDLIKLHYIVLFKFLHYVELLTMSKTIKKTSDHYQFSLIFSHTIFYDDFLPFFGPKVRKNSTQAVEGRLNAWCHQKAESILKHNLYDPLLAIIGFFQKKNIQCQNWAKLAQFGDNLRPNLSQNLKKFMPLGIFQVFLQLCNVRTWI